MWILSLEWLLLAVFVFWGIGALKRLKRLRQESKQTFAAVDAQLLQTINWLRSCARRKALKERVDGFPSAHAQHALLPSADLLENALLQARQHPLKSETIAALESTWQGAQVAWLAYMQLSQSAVNADQEQAQEWALRWQELTTVHRHSTEQFNAAVNDYNQAIAQFPACAIARLSGLKAARTYQKDAALLMQSSA